MTAGRPRKPTRLKVIQGNPGKRRLPQGEPKPVQASLAAPEWLNAGGVAIWDDYAPKLHKLGLLTELDVEFLAIACQQLVIYRRMMKKVGERTAVRQDGKTKQEYIVANKALEQAQRILIGFGFMSADRAKLSVTAPSADPFEEFLGKASSV